MIRAEHSEDVVGVRGRVAFVRKSVFVFTGGFASVSDANQTEVRDTLCRLCEVA